MQWKAAILEIIKQHDPGAVDVQQIYTDIQHDQFVTAHHREPWSSGLQPRYHCWVRRYLTDLVRERKIRRVSRGTYSFLHS